jgi:hypothetical protein
MRKTWQVSQQKDGIYQAVIESGMKDEAKWG